MNASSQTQLAQSLEPVCRRMKQRTALCRAWQGLAGAAALSMVLGVYGVFSGSLLPLALSLLLILVVPTVAAIFPLMSQSNLREAARLADRYYELKDRTTTALELAQRRELLPIQQMQIREATTRLQRVSARDVVPLDTPRNLLNIVGLLLLAMLLNAWPLFPSHSSNSNTTAHIRTVEQSGESTESPQVTMELARASRKHVRPYAGASLHSQHDPPLRCDTAVIDKYFATLGRADDGDRR